MSLVPMTDELPASIWYQRREPMARMPPSIVTVNGASLSRDREIKHDGPKFQAVSLMYQPMGYGDA